MKQTEFINKVFEIAFGDNARPEYLNDIPKDDRRLPFTFEEVLQVIQMHETNSFKVEDLEESEGFVQDDIIKINGKKYKVHIDDEEKLFLKDEDVIEFEKNSNESSKVSNKVSNKIRCKECGAIREREDWLDHISDGGHASESISANYDEIPESELCKNCHGNGYYMGDIFVGDKKVGYDQIDCEDCNGTGVKEE